MKNVGSVNPLILPDVFVQQTSTPNSGSSLIFTGLIDHRGFGPREDLTLFRILVDGRSAAIAINGSSNQTLQVYAYQRESPRLEQDLASDNTGIIREFTDVLRPFLIPKLRSYFLRRNLCGQLLELQRLSKNCITANSQLSQWVQLHQNLAEISIRMNNVLSR